MQSIWLLRRACYEDLLLEHPQRTSSHIPAIYIWIFYQYPWIIHQHPINIHENYEIKRRLADLDDWIFVMDGIPEEYHGIWLDLTIKNPSKTIKNHPTSSSFAFKKLKNKNESLLSSQDVHNSPRIANDEEVSIEVPGLKPPISGIWLIKNRQYMVSIWFVMMVNIWLMLLVFGAFLKIRKPQTGWFTFYWTSFYKWWLGVAIF